MVSFIDDGISKQNPKKNKKREGILWSSKED
jgi:hypothetical protein